MRAEFNENTSTEYLEYRDEWVDSTKMDLAAVVLKLMG
jgi:hypothetical protein